MERQLVVTQLPVLLEKRTAQHRFRRQAMPAGLLHPAAPQILCHQPRERWMLIQPAGHRL